MRMRILEFLKEYNGFRFRQLFKQAVKSNSRDCSVSKWVSGCEKNFFNSSNIKASISLIKDAVNFFGVSLGYDSVDGTFVYECRIKSKSNTNEFLKQIFQKRIIDSVLNTGHTSKLFINMLVISNKKFSFKSRMVEDFTNKLWANALKTRDKVNYNSSITRNFCPLGCERLDSIIHVFYECNQLKNARVAREEKINKFLRCMGVQQVFSHDEFNLLGLYSNRYVKALYNECTKDGVTLNKFSNLLLEVIMTSNYSLWLTRIEAVNCEADPMAAGHLIS